MQSDNKVSGDTKGNKFTAKSGAFTCILAFGIPNNRSFVDEDQNASLRATSEQIPCMIGVYKTGNVNQETSRLWHMRWEFVMGIGVKVCPISNMEALVIDVRICRLKYESGIFVGLQVQEYVIDCLQMTFSRKYVVSG